LNDGELNKLNDGEMQWPNTTLQSTENEEVRRSGYRVKETKFQWKDNTVR